jgi:phosphatidylglycerol:prolipoprotein diacylglycerol transferase
MYPILYNSPGFILYTQTVLLAIAFIAGLLLAIREAHYAGIPRFELTNVVLVGFISSIIGARAFFLLLTWKSANLTLQELCTIGKLDGGFAFHGGLLFGGLAGWFVTIYYHLPVWRMGDVLAPGLSIALFFMRLGCLMNGCDYGIPSGVPWAITLHGAPRHPIQLYEGIGNLLLLPLLLLLNRKPIRPGTTLLCYVLLSSLLRIGVDVFRADSIRYWHLTIPQFVALGIAVIAGILLCYRTGQANKPNV